MNDNTAIDNRTTEEVIRDYNLRCNDLRARIRMLIKGADEDELKRVAQQLADVETREEQRFALFLEATDEIQAIVERLRRHHLGFFPLDSSPRSCLEVLDAVRSSMLAADNVDGCCEDEAVWKRLTERPSPLS